MIAAGAGTAVATSPGSTDELRLTTTKPGTPTGLVASEVFNARYPNGQLKPLRHSLVGFPKGTAFDAQAADTCAAGDSDFRARGMSACPASSKIGYGHATAVTTGTLVELGPFGFDVTVFGRKDGSIIVFSSHGLYLSSALVRADGRFQHTSPRPNCIVVVEQSPCPHGEFAPRSLTVTIPARSRVIHGRRHSLITTPRTCPRTRRWTLFDKHTFADRSFDLFVNHLPCRR